MSPHVEQVTPTSTSNEQQAGRQAKVQYLKCDGPAGPQTWVGDTCTDNHQSHQVRAPKFLQAQASDHFAAQNSPNWPASGQNGPHTPRPVYDYSPSHTTIMTDWLTTGIGAINSAPPVGDEGWTRVGRGGICTTNSHAFMVSLCCAGLYTAMGWTCVAR